VKRREFIGVVGGAIVWPLVARAQRPAGRIYRVGYLSITQQLHLIKAFEGGLWSFAYRVGENAVIEY
jgi:putative ABC transport system substrate-binding protein